MKRLTTACAILALSAFTAQAQASGTLNLELNAAQSSEKGCRLTFVVNNGLSTALTNAGFEIALFDKAGVVDRITVLSFKDLAAGKTKVSRFDLAGVDCAKLGRVLINETKECVGEGVAADACSRQLKTASKADGIEFGV